MTMILIAAICCGCNTCNVKAQAVAAPVVTTTAAYVQVPVLDPYWHYAAGTAERIRRLEEIAERQQRTLELLTQSGAASAPSAEQSPAQKLIADRCVKCHSGDAAKGGVRLDQELDTATKLLVAEVVQSGAMPPKPAPELTDDEAATIAAAMAADSKALRQWLRAQRIQQPAPTTQPPTPNP